MYSCVIMYILHTDVDVWREGCGRAMQKKLVFQENPWDNKRRNPWIHESVNPRIRESENPRIRNSNMYTAEDLIETQFDDSHSEFAFSSVLSEVFIESWNALRRFALRITFPTLLPSFHLRVTLLANVQPDAYGGGTNLSGAACAHSPILHKPLQTKKTWDPSQIHLTCTEETR